MTNRRVFVCAALVAVATLGGCARQGDAVQGGETELPTLDVTNWTDKTELFMEHPPLVAGETVRFAVHLTRMSDFSALNAGRPHIELTPESRT